MSFCLQNKYMFVYLSLLVEMKYFTTIEVYFLLVGHTHCSIDQYFSVLSKAIAEKSFIGSTLALVELLMNAHKGENAFRRPAFMKEVAVYYDYRTAFKPYINNKIVVRLCTTILQTVLMLTSISPCFYTFCSTFRFRTAFDSRVF